MSNEKDTEKYKRRSPELFDAFVQEVKFEYPICIEYTEGVRYGTGNVEAFFENGVRAFISTKGNTSTFSKTKFVPKYILTIEDARKEYEMYIKTLLYIHKEITPEEFNKRYELMDKINNSLDSLIFEDAFRQAKYEAEKADVSKLIKTKEKIPDEKTSFEHKQPETDYPF
jgi:hypothetical protein